MRVFVGVSVRQQTTVRQWALVRHSLGQTDRVLSVRESTQELLARALAREVSEIERWLDGGDDVSGSQS